MTKPRATQLIGLGFCGAMLVAAAAMAQMPLPEAKPPDGPTLFKQQCARQARPEIRAAIIAYLKELH